MHSSIGRRLSTDAKGTLLLTCSDDKTARLWDAATGKQLQVFRIPIGETREGRLYACALSGDGKIATLAGQTGFEWSNTYTIYLVNTQTGELIQSIESIPAIINDLEFSPDGKFLAAGLGKTSGVKVYETLSWKEVKSLEGFGAAVFSIAFNNKGKLAAACFDGKLRLYNNSFELEKVVGTNSQRLISVAFDPTGNLLACGYHDSPVVEVRNTADLSINYLPDLKNADKEAGGLEILQFSADGKRLYGGGRQAQKENNNWRWMIRCWDNKKGSEGKDLSLLKNAVNDMKALPDGSLAVLGTYPDLALIKNGKQVWYQGAIGLEQTAADPTHFRVNKKGNQISMNTGSEADIFFDVLQRNLTEGNLKEKPPLDSILNLVVKDWQNGLSPSINGQKISFLTENERCFAVDITEGGEQIAMAGSFAIYLSNPRAEKLWRTAVPATAISINISDNEKILVATLSDGTVRWYAMADGKELLAFFLTADKSKWVLFTPSGYFDASPGAEDLLGWHLNNGPSKTPSFYPISRFRDKYYRPDIIDAIFETYNESQAIAISNQRKGIKEDGTLMNAVSNKPPPLINIISPSNGSEVIGNTVTLNYTLSYPDNAPVKSVKVLINGRPFNTTRGIKTISAGNNSLEINIPSSDCVVTLLAENENGTSPEANIYLKWKAGSVSTEDIAKPTLYILSIGISKYQKENYRLNLASKDAGDFTKAMLGQRSRFYKDVVVKTLFDEQATKINILDGLEWIQKNTRRTDMAMIFFAGHGLNDDNGIYYMLPADADADRLRSTCINFEEIKQTQSTIEGKVIVFIDACHSGNISGGTGNYINGMINLLTSTVKGAGAITFTSSTGKEVSFEDNSWGNGAFTKALVEGINGAAAIDEEKEITYTSLSLYISRRVKKLTDNRQHPTLIPTPNTPDFTIGKSK